MSENRMLILEYVALGRLSVLEAVTLLKVLAEIEALDMCCVELPAAASIEVYLN